MPENSDSTTSMQNSNHPNPVAFQAQYQQLYPASSNAFSNQLDMSQQQGADRQGPYNMNAMANALPQTSYRPGYPNGQQPRYCPSGPNMAPQIMQYGQQHMNQQYYMPQQQPMSPYYTQMPTSSHHQQHPISPRSNMNMGYYPNMMNQSQAGMPGYYYPQSNQYPAQNPPMHGHMPQPQYYLPDGSPVDSRDPSALQRENLHMGGVTPFPPNDDAIANRPNVVRGPPRKPRQSGHAIWIGNLPPQADLMSLVHHVCKEAPGLESLFLISKSNCAFANFKDEATCVAAQQKLHDSKFQSVRLVSRLRKSTVEGASGQTAPTGPSATSPQPVVSEPTISGPVTTAPPTTATEVEKESQSTPITDGTVQQDKFFILKSLTVEDLELSVRNGVWATQSHNEDILNNAFGAVDNVYLIFSANKSGEYFGYARMTSPIDDDPAAAIEFAPKAQPADDVDVPRAIPTEATDTCPRGRIIDDSARGTIFWEIERDEADVTPESLSEDSRSSKSAAESEGSPKAWGKPFKLEWLSTARLPFYRTRGLRNPWNSNREVKIARDGTELEPTVGRRLIGLFNRGQSPARIPPMNRGPMPMVAGYPPQMQVPYRQ
ncbi:hypothetical protein F5Y16DRAFT_410986 [Xylariaceae sp. FL0255]|nr:hypothetical protein F5Y16DRAFT_410986 [Xylariaceae sp. FL0255]